MQHPLSMRPGPLSIPESRTGSGTSWLPDASPMHAAHKMLGNWTLMLHGIGVLEALLTATSVGHEGTWSSALIYGANDEIGPAGLKSSVVLESTLEPDRRSSFFGRVEYVRKSARELVITGVAPTTEYDIAAFALGYARTIGTLEGLHLAAGVRGSMNFVPAGLEAAYGSRTPSGLAVYFRARPAGGGSAAHKRDDMTHMHEEGDR